MKFTFPSDYSERECYLVPINAALIPLVAGALKKFEERRSWHDDSEYELAYNAFVDLQGCFMQLCVRDLIESNDRLYRMLDTALYGTEYTIQGIDPIITDPTIQATHSLDIQDARSILGRLNSVQLLLDNALNGATNGEYSQPIGVRETLQDILATLQSGDNLDAEMLQRLTAIVGLLG